MYAKKLPKTLKLVPISKVLDKTKNAWKACKNDEMQARKRDKRKIKERAREDVRERLSCKPIKKNPKERVKREKTNLGDMKLNNERILANFLSCSSYDPPCPMYLIIKVVKIRLGTPRM